MNAGELAPFGGKARILILSHYYWPEISGNGPYVTGLAEHLATQGHRVEVATGFPHFPQWRPLWPRKARQVEERNGVRIRRSWHTVPGRQSAASRAFYELSSLSAGALRLQGARPDVIVGVIPNLSAAVAAYALSRRFRTPYALIFQDLMGRAATQNGVDGGQRVADIVGTIELASARSADAVGVVAEGFAQYLGDGGVPSDRILRLRNWTKACAPTIQRKEMRNRLGWLPGQFVCLHAGNMGRKQDLENVLRAARLVQERGLDDFHFVLAGDGNDRARLEARARDQGLTNVSFLNSQPPGDYESLLQAADVLVVNQRASLADSALPSKLTSYFPAGRPIVAAASSDSETAKEICTSQGGVLVDADCPQAFAEAIISLRDDEPRCVELGENGRRYAERLTPASVLGEYERLIGTAIDGGRTR